jgi:hypothetical protein
MSDAGQFLDDAEAYIARGRALLASGETDALLSLDAQASQLSAKAAPLLNELKASHGKRFAAVLAELETLVGELQAARCSNSAAPALPMPPPMQATKREDDSMIG